ncbi:hypothetical protein [Bartonella sp. DGB2]|uniref:hypothetical protein n=1 Tax=Bartonella sp. DGB2 TaxID=3388426 RepID=UPI00398FA0AE
MQDTYSDLKRQAINELLATIGQDPIETLENLPPAGNTALNTLDRITEELQEQGYWFNLYPNYRLEPNTDGEILLSDTIINIKENGGLYARREGKLYDLSRQSFLFSQPVQCTVVLRLSWDDLPPEARRYIIALSVEQFVEGFPSGAATATARARSLQRAKTAFTNAQIKASGINLLNNAYISQQITR